MPAGTWAEWAAGVGAVALLAWTWWAWRHDRSTTEEQHRRAAAALVSVWFEPDLPGISAWGMAVENRGPEVIYEWEACTWWVRLGEPHPGPHWETRHLSSLEHGPLPAGRKRQRALAHGEVPIPSSAATAVKAAMIWRDPAGDRWWLRYGGALHASDSKPPYPWASRSLPGQDAAVGVVPD